MNTKIIIAATVAALSLATTAFAAEGNGATGNSAIKLVADTGSEQYPAVNPAFNLTGLNNAALSPNGQQGEVVSANSLPVGADVGTGAYSYGQSTYAYFARQANARFALAHHLQPNS